MLGSIPAAPEREAEDDGAGAVPAPPAIDFPKEGSDPKYDESDVPAELQVLKGPQQQQPTFPFAVANQLLLVSLLEHLSHVHEPNPFRSRQVFKLLCQTFIKMGLLSSFTCSDEFSSLRLHHNRAITHLMRSARESVRQDPCEDSSHIPKIRSREVAFEAQTSRYLNEFEEVSILGKGGYGRVYKVRNKLDGQYYAIKKILIKGATKTDCMKVLREVKVLAGLQHPNIVGYHTAWIEHVHVAQTQADRISLQLPSLKVISAQEGDRDQYDVKNDESNSSSIIFAELTSEKEKLLGESGIENQNNKLVNYSPNLVTRDASGFELSIGLQENGLAEWSSRSMAANQLPLQLNSDLEGNFTSTEESSEENLNMVGQTEMQYHLMLHIQMQLCELSLWDWIVERNRRSRECVDESACPYVMASVATKIFQELVEGVFYIHSMGVVHRDLKPRNIFLHGPDQQVKIGDFGLACTDIIQNPDWTGRGGKNVPRPINMAGALSLLLGARVRAVVARCGFATQGVAGPGSTGREPDPDSDWEPEERELQEVESALKRQKKAILFQKIRRQMEPRGAPPRTLTREAMEQMRYLHEEFPESWSVPRLAEGFAVSTDVIRRVLKSKFVPTLEKKLKQDQKVLKKAGLAPSLRQLPGPGETWKLLSAGHPVSGGEASSQGQGHSTALKAIEPNTQSTNTLRRQTGRNKGVQSLEKESCVPVAAAQGHQRELPKFSTSDCEGTRGTGSDGLPSARKLEELRARELGPPTHTSRVGTCLYASPEQLEGSEYDAQSDMYSLGVILLELFQPFGTEMERAQVLTGLRTGQMPESLSQRCPVQARCIQELTRKNASQRPSAMQLLQSDLFQNPGSVNLTLQMKIVEQEKEIEELKKQLRLLSQNKGVKDDMKDGGVPV